VVTVIAILTLVEHISGVSFGIDTLILNRPWGQRASAAPMRMGLPASTSFTILGIALLLATSFARRARQIASVLAVAPVGIASMSLVGYLFGADQLFGIARLTVIALQSCMML